MSELVNRTLQKTIKGGGLVFIGTSVGMILGFVSRMIMVRHITQDEYGIYALVFTLMNLLGVIATLGMDVGATRQIAFYRGRDDTKKVIAVIVASLIIGIIGSIVISTLVFITSDLVSSKLFDETALTNPLRIIAIALPFSVLIGMLGTFFRGFGQAGPSVFFQSFLKGPLFVVLLITVICLDLPFIGVIYAFMASIVLTSVAFVVYAWRKAPLSMGKRINLKVGLPYKELLLLSLPLLAVNVLNSLTTWTDTLMLGVFKTLEDVGAYGAAGPLAMFLSTALTSIRFLYVPLATQLYARNQMEEINRSFVILTKWVFAATLPIFLVFALFPESVISNLFGSDYVDGAVALRILSLGFFCSTILGPNGATLIVMAKTRFLLVSTLIAVVANILLNCVLIPPFGIAGAAIATAASLGIKNVMWAVKLYSLSNIHPFTKSFLKPVIVSSIPIFIIYMIATNLFDPAPLWLLPIIGVVFTGVYVAAVLFTKSIDQEELEMLLAVESRLGINLGPLRKVLSRFT